MTRALLVLVALTSVLGGALANHPEPLEAQLEHARPPTWEGYARFSGEGAALDLRPDVEAGRSVVLEWSGARGHVVTRSVVRAEGPESFNYDADPRQDNFTWGSGRLRDIRCSSDPCDVFLFALPGQPDALWTEGEYHGEPEWLAEPRVYHGYYSDKPRPYSFYHKLPDGSLVAREGEGRGLATSSPGVAGRVGLFLQNATAVLERPGEEPALLDTTTRRGDGLHLPVGGGVEQRGRRHAYIELDGASLAPLGDSDSVLYLPNPHVHLEGVLSSPDARGRLEWGGRDLALDGEAIQITGSLAIAPIRGRTALVPLLSPDAAERDALAGEATSVSVGGAGEPPGRGHPVKVVAGAGLAAALLTVLAL